MIQRIQATLEPLRDPTRALAMAAYMKHHFAFLGIPMPARVAALRPIWKTWRPTRLELLELTLNLWALPEREYQYAALTALERHWTLLAAADLEGLCRLVATEKSWWDTIDTIDGIAGRLVRRHPALESLMDEFALHDNFWLRRIAIQHQLGNGWSTNTEQLFRYALQNASHESFWIKKSLGWALREYAKTNPSAVLEFIEKNDGAFSKLTVREALKHFSKTRGA